MDLEVRRFFYARGIIQEYNKYTTWQFLTTHDRKCHESDMIKTDVIRNDNIRNDTIQNDRN